MKDTFAKIVNKYIRNSKQTTTKMQPIIKTADQKINIQFTSANLNNIQLHTVVDIKYTVSNQEPKILLKRNLNTNQKLH